MPPSAELDDAFAASLETWMPKSATWLLAVSGGLDSMVLLHFLHRVGYRSLLVCHINHQLRGAESEADAALVRSVSEALGLECHTARVNVSADAAARKCSIEYAARELRYRAFTEVGAERNLSDVVTAHHADDQVETVLINLFRGTGACGISGMEPVSERLVGAGRLRIFRPFLSLRRRELERYAKEHDVAYRQDQSNFEDFALRNRVRNTLIPWINDVFARDVSSAVLRAAVLAARDEAWISGALGELPQKGSGLDVAALRGMPGAMRDRLLLQWLRENEIPDCGFEEVSRLSGLLLSDRRPAKINLPGGWHARRRAGILFLEKAGG